MQLQVVSWNLDGRNLRAGNAIADALSLDPDVVCLQEVPEFEIEKLSRKSAYQVFTVLDGIINGTKSYLCTLVRRELGAESITKEYGSDESAWLGKRLLGWEWNLCLSSQSVLVEIDGEHVRVVNCHLDATGSIVERHNMLKRIASEHIGSNEKRVIFCGDLNTFGCVWRNLWAGWFFGIKASEVPRNEQDMLSDFLDASPLQRVSSTPYDWKTSLPARATGRRTTTTGK